MDFRPKKMTIAEICPRNATLLPDRLVGESTQESDVGRAPTQAAEGLGADPGEGSPSGPRDKMARVADKAETVERTQKVEVFIGRSNFSKGCDLSLTCVAPRIRCWGAVRDLRGRPHFPPTEEAVLVAFSSRNDVPAVSVASGKSLLFAGMRPQLATQSRSTGADAGRYAKVLRKNPPL